jgi:DNA-binding protein Fis
VSVTNNPQEDSILQVSQIVTNKIISCLKEHVHGKLIEYVFDLDEVGICEWENWNAKEFDIPLLVAGRPIHHEIDRNMKHISMIVCISSTKR